MESRHKKRYVYRTLHALRNLNTQESHTVLQDLRYVLGQHQADGLLLLVRLVQDGVIVIELVEHLGQLVAVVGNAGRRVVLTSLLYGSTILAQFLDEFNFLFCK